MTIVINKFGFEYVEIVLNIKYDNNMGSFVKFLDKYLEKPSYFSKKLT